MRAELNWWVQNINLNKGETLLSNPPQLIIASDASLKSCDVYCQGHKTGDPWTLSDPERAQKCFRDDCSKICNSTIHSVKPFGKINPGANGQRSCIVVSHKSGGDSEQSFLLTGKRDLGLFNKKWDHYYSRLSSRGNEQGSRFSVTKREGFKRVKAQRSSISKKLSLAGNPKFEAFCISSASPNSSLHVVETRTLQQKQGCFSDLMDTHEELYFTTILADRSGFEESGNRSRNFDLNNTNVADTVLVSTTPSNGSEKPLLLPKTFNLLIPNQENHVLFEKGRLQLLGWTVSGKSYFLKDYQKNLSLLSQMPEERAKAHIMNRSAVSRIAGVVGERLIPLNVLLKINLIF